jgi:hypothetical protein
VAGNCLDWDIVYQGAESMNSLKHQGLPVMAVCFMEGEKLRALQTEGSASRVLRLSCDLWLTWGSSDRDSDCPCHTGSTA